jgi:hypothetical protein
MKSKRLTQAVLSAALLLSGVYLFERPATAETQNFVCGNSDCSNVDQTQGCFFNWQCGPLGSGATCCWFN